MEDLLGEHEIKYGTVWGLKLINSLNHYGFGIKMATRASKKKEALVKDKCDYTKVDHYKI